jgi:hypothetical protein
MKNTPAQRESKYLSHIDSAYPVVYFRIERDPDLNLKFPSPLPGRSRAERAVPYSMLFPILPTGKEITASTPRYAQRA